WPAGLAGVSRTRYLPPCCAAAVGRFRGGGGENSAAGFGDSGTHDPRRIAGRAAATLGRRALPGSAASRGEPAMTATIADKRARFRQLHERGCFVLPNPWDVGSAAMLQHLGFKALASTSAGMAWAMGRADGQVSLDEVLLHLSA